jgi:hypothetical protein
VTPECELTLEGDAPNHRRREELGLSASFGYSIETQRRWRADPGEVPRLLQERSCTRTTRGSASRSSKASTGPGRRRQRQAADGALLPGYSRLAFIGKRTVIVGTTDDDDTSAIDAQIDDWQFLVRVAARDARQRRRTKWTDPTASSSPTRRRATSTSWSRTSPRRSGRTSRRRRDAEVASRPTRRGDAALGARRDGLGGHREDVQLARPVPRQQVEHRRPDGQRHRRGQRERRRLDRRDDGVGNVQARDINNGALLTGSIVSFPSGFANPKSAWRSAAGWHTSSTLRATSGSCSRATATSRAARRRASRPTGSSWTRARASSGSSAAAGDRHLPRAHRRQHASTRSGIRGWRAGLRGDHGRPVRPRRHEQRQRRPAASAPQAAHRLQPGPLREHDDVPTSPGEPTISSSGRG